MNATTYTMIDIKGFRPVAAADSGECDRCGTICPKERVLMAAVDADGVVRKDMTESWGKCCAAAYCYGSKSKTNRDRVTSAIAEYQRNEQAQHHMWMRRIATDATFEYVDVRYTNSGFRIEERKTIHLECVLSAANRKYSATRLPVEGSIAMINDQGHMVRTAADRPQEREFYASKGFKVWTR
jgi:hypothetical protein